MIASVLVRSRDCDLVFLYFLLIRTAPPDMPSEANKYVLSLLALCGSSSYIVADELAAPRYAYHSGMPTLRSRHTAPRLQPSSSASGGLQGLAATAVLRLQGGTVASAIASAKVPLAFAGWYLMSIFYSVLVRCRTLPLL